MIRRYASVVAVAFALLAAITFSVVLLSIVAAAQTGSLGPEDPTSGYPTRVVSVYTHPLVLIPTAAAILGWLILVRTMWREAARGEPQ